MGLNFGSILLSSVLLLNNDGAFRILLARKLSFTRPKHEYQSQTTNLRLQIHQKRTAHEVKEEWLVLILCVYLEV